MVHAMRIVPVRQTGRFHPESRLLAGNPKGPVSCSGAANRTGCGRCSASGRPQRYLRTCMGSAEDSLKKTAGKGPYEYCSHTGLDL